MGHPMRYRVAALLGVIALTVAASFVYDLLTEATELDPHPTLITDTLFGAYLALLIPVLLGWVCLAARRIWVRVLGLMIAVVLFVYCIAVTGILGPPGGVY